MMLKLKTIKAENLFSWKHLDMEFDENSAYSLQGLNGSGKSSIFEIIIWVLFKKTTKKTVKGDNGETDGYGIVVFNDGTEIKRSTDTPTSVLKNGCNIEQDNLEEFIGGNFSVFMSSNMCSQERVSSFINEKTDTGKSKIFGDMLGCGKLDKMRAKVQTKRNQYEVEYESVKEQSVSLKEIVESCKLEFEEMDLKSFKDSIETDRNEIIEIEKDIKVLKKSEQEARELNNSWSAYENNLKIIKDNLADIQTDKEFLQVLQPKISQLKKEDYDLQIKTLEDNIAKQSAICLENSIKRRNCQSEISSLENIISIKGNCPTCGTLITKEHKHSITEKIQSLKNSMEKIQPLKLNEELNVNIKELKAKRKMLQDLQLDFDKIESKIEVRQKQITLLKNNAKKPTQDKVDVSTISTTIENKARRSSILLKGIDNKERALKAYSEAESRLKEAEERVSKSKKIYTIYNWLFKHIPLMKLKYINENKIALEEMINEYISMIHLPFVVKIETQKELKSSGELKDVFSFKILNTKNKKEVDNKDLSGGEKICILLATQFAISDIGGTHLGFEIYDEIYGALDDKNLDAVINMIKNRSEEVQLFSISHKDEISKSFNNIIHIYKKDGYSYVR